MLGGRKWPSPGLWLAVGALVAVLAAYVRHSPLYWEWGAGRQARRGDATRTGLCILVCQIRMCSPDGILGDRWAKLAAVCSTGRSPGSGTPRKLDNVRLAVAMGMESNGHVYLQRFLDAWDQPVIVKAMPPGVFSERDLPGAVRLGDFILHIYSAGPNGVDEGGKGDDIVCSGCSGPGEFRGSSGDTDRENPAPDRATGDD